MVADGSCDESQAKADEYRQGGYSEDDNDRDENVITIGSVGFYRWRMMLYEKLFHA
jgi:hypothetical protein